MHRLRIALGGTLTIAVVSAVLGPAGVACGGRSDILDGDARAVACPVGATPGGACSPDYPGCPNPPVSSCICQDGQWLCGGACNNEACPEPSEVTPGGPCGVSRFLLCPSISSEATAGCPPGFSSANLFECSRGEWTGAGPCCGT